MASSFTMPHATPPRVHARRGIKPEPELHTSPTFPLLHRQRNSQSHSSNSSQAGSARLPVDQAFYRESRSDAPAPSERLSESEPLLREVRTRLPPQVVDMPGEIVDESFSFHQSFHDIGQKLKACNDTLGELQQLGVGVNHDVQLPELVLVGDQSAGKSSLMSGLAGIDLPRSEGTCTRCPLHIRVSSSNEWSCRVGIRKDYTYQPPEGQPIEEDDVNDEHPFFPWRKLPSTKFFEFKTMQDRSEIEDVLRWAQIAILHDELPVDRFVPGSGVIAMNQSVAEAASQPSAKFSPNLVALEIKGPSLPDLSFYDLPGIFQNTADSRDSYLVKVVKYLSQEYIRHPSAVILAALPMNVDPENSGTLRIIRRLQAEDRTIGVLTKADLLAEKMGNGNGECQWRRILVGQAHQLGHGYFVTSRKPGMDLESLKQWEEQMFINKTTDKWPECLHEFEDRCGVDKLMLFLSQQLGEEFALSLPTIKRKVEHRYHETRAKLQKLPDLPSNVEAEIQRSLLQFDDAGRRAIENFANSFNVEPQRFQECLLRIKPRFIMRDPSDAPVVEISDDEDGDEVMGDSNATSTPSKRRMGPPANTPKRPRFQNSLQGNLANGSTPAPSIKSEDTLGPQPTPAATPMPSPSKQRNDPYSSFESPTNLPRTLRQVRAEISRKRRAGVPNLIPEMLYEDMVIKAMVPWKGPLEEFLKITMSGLLKELNVALAEAFLDLKKRRVYKEAKKHLREFLESQSREFGGFLTLLYKKESGKLYTMNVAAFDLYREDDVRELRRFRLHHRLLAQGMVEKSDFVRWDDMDETRRGEEQKMYAKSLARVGKDNFEREVEVMSYVRAYYRLAALRFSDDAAQAILCLLVPEIRVHLNAYLETQLGVNSRGNSTEAHRAIYERLMEEDDETAEKRDALKNDLKKFEKALQSIESLQTGGVVSNHHAGQAVGPFTTAVSDDGTMADGDD